MNQKTVKLLILWLALTVFMLSWETANGLEEVASTSQSFGKGNAPKYELIDIAKTKYKSRDLKGKVIIIDCWATWCKPCQKGIPELVKIREKYRDRLVLFGVSYDETLESVQEYLKNNKVGQLMNYPIIFEPKLPAKFGDIPILPTTFILDKAGSIRFRHNGYVPMESLERNIEALLNEQ